MSWILLEGRWYSLIFRGSSNGRTSGSGPENRGSNPCPRAIINYKNMKNIIILVVIIAAIWLVSDNLNFFKTDKIEEKTEEKITVVNFVDCEAAGFEIMESYPRQCTDQDGNIFVEDIGNELEKTDLIRINTPRPNQVITSPLTIRGEARGYWFFEADFPVILVGSQGGNILVESFASTKDNWMTEEFIPFEAVIEFDASDQKNGLLILEKDNPSGLLENYDSLNIPIKF